MSQRNKKCEACSYDLRGAKRRHVRGPDSREGRFTRSDQSEPTFAGIRPTDVPPFRAAQIVGARFAFFVSLAHVKDRLKQGDGVFESGLRNRRQIAQNLGKRMVSI